MWQGWILPLASVAVSIQGLLFDGVKLTPGQFRVSKDELGKAHRQMNQDILASLRQAIENVRAYQKDILVKKHNVPRGESPRLPTRGGAAGIRYTAIRRIGICVPGVSAARPRQSPSPLRPAPARRS